LPEERMGAPGRADSTRYQADSTRYRADSTRYQSE
jgi:hypothetical protein